MSITSVAGDRHRALSARVETSGDVSSFRGVPVAPQGKRTEGFDDLHGTGPARRTLPQPRNRRSLGEVRYAPWAALQGDRFTVGWNRTKRTAARTRVIEVADLTVHESKQWRMESGRPGEDEPIIGEMSPNVMKL